MTEKPGASHAIDVREYISPFQLKHESYSHARKKYVNELFDDIGKWDSGRYECSRRVEEHKDATDLHYQWTIQREKYACSGDLHDLLRMLDFVTPENPPENSPAASQPGLFEMLYRSIFRSGRAAG